MDKLNLKFLEETSKIKEPEVFIGVARILKVPLLKEEKDEDGKFPPREFIDLYIDVLSSYETSSRKRKRELLKILREANKKEGKVKNADRTENPEESIPHEEV